MNYWLFQANPKIYDLKQVLKDGQKETWRLRKHQKHVRRGDQVVMCLSGKNAGIYGLATVETDPAVVPLDELERKYWKGDETELEKDGHLPQVKLSIKHNLSDCPVLRSEIMNSIGALKELPIGREGSEFTIKTQEIFDEAKAKILDHMKGEPMEGAKAGSSPFDDQSKYPSKNIILYGPPGTGKTWHVNGEDLKEKGLEIDGKKYTPRFDVTQFVTFHQSYSYEDFIEGIKPKIIEGIEPSAPKRKDNELAYGLVDGIFKTIAEEARGNHLKTYALIIDEINRGNVASIFGELITLIEEDKRLGKENAITVMLPYSHNENKQFGVPQNLYIIGTMNTADRSVEALDTALRRRFTFLEMRPDRSLVPDPAGMRVDLKRLFDVINARIEQLLDHDHCIGHAYFMGVKDITDLRLVFANKIIPLLREYFYGSPEKVGMVLGKRFVTQKTGKTDFASGEWDEDKPDEKKVYVFEDVTKFEAEHFASIYA